MGVKHQTWPQQWPKQSAPPCIRGGHPQLDYLTRPKKSSWATNYKIIDVHPKLIPKGGVVQFCQIRVWVVATSSPGLTLDEQPLFYLYSKV